MRLRTKRNQLSRRHCQKRQTANGPEETKRRCQLAQTQHSNGNPQVPRVYRVLPILHPRILKNRTTTARSHKESSDLELGRTTATRIRRVEDPHVLTTCSYPTKFR